MPIFIAVNTNISLAPFAEKRVKFIRDQFSSIADPNTPIQLPVQAFFAQNSETKEVVVFAENQTTYSKDLITTEIDLKRFFLPLKKIIDRYELSETFNISLILRWIENSKGKDVFLQSLSFINPSLTSVINSACNTVNGIGLRLLTKKDDGAFDEFKIEPFISDNKKVFFETTHNINSISINEIENKITELIDSDTKCVNTMMELLSKNEQ